MISQGMLHCPLRFDSCRECVGKEVREEYVLLVDRREKIIETSENCEMTSPPGKTDARDSRGNVQNFVSDPLAYLIQQYSIQQPG